MVCWMQIIFLIRSNIWLWEFLIVVVIVDAMPSLEGSVGQGDSFCQP